MIVQNDRYLYFTYNGAHSSKYGVFYINRGEDITLPFVSTSVRNFASPLYQNVSYNLGVHNKERTYKLQLAADQRNLNDIQDIIQWLDVGSLGELIFDYRPDYQFNVYVKSVRPPVIIPHEFPDNTVRHIALFEVEFQTTGDHLASTREPYIISNIKTSGTTSLYEPDELLPIYRKLEGKNYFINWTLIKQFIDINIVGSSFEINKYNNQKKETYYKYSSLPNGSITEIKTDMGVALSKGKLVEKNYPNSLETNKGPMPIDSGLVYSGRVPIEIKGTGRIKITNQFKAFNKQDKLFLYVDLPLKENEILEPNEDGRFWFKGYYKQAIDASGQKRIQLPKILPLTVNSSDEFVFDNSDINLTDGEYNIKIAKGIRVDFDVAGGDASITFRYRKGV